MATSYDVIVVGARCAGSPTAMLLARAGLRVLLVDRATFPSDTLSTHVVQPHAVTRLARWGLLDRVVASGCPPVDTYAYDFGPFTIAGRPGTDDAPVAYCPRRTVLDEILVDGAAEAGAEVREGFRVDEILFDDGCVTGIRGVTRDGAPLTERARIVVGADGWRSRVAEAVQPASYREKPALLAGYYSYFRGLPMGGRFEIYIRPYRGFAAAPTNDDLTLVIAGWPASEFQAKKSDVERHFHETIALAPHFAERLAAAERVERFAGAVIPNWFRKPFGPGWALVGDAGYLKDSITAQGIHDAFRDAERLATALVGHLRDGRDWNEALAAYQHDRDEDSIAMYEFTTQLATLEPPPPEQLPLFQAIHRSREASDDFARMNAGTISPATFFAPANIERILGSNAGA
jgi:2-polyprenyl-6-methoxyphenol hydroxylase-like FAD-dependent oxidoreductase